MPAMTRYIIPGFLAAGAVICGFFWLKEEVTTRIYRAKLDSLAAEYQALTEHYNEAVRQSAITELEVTENSVSILIRTMDGEIRKIPTPYDPKREIFVDYIVGDGRIWIRRVFDQDTPPGEAMVIDPLWEFVDWGKEGLSHGKIVYRSLEPGLWSIQVSGNGALSLEPVPSTQIHRLESSPVVRSYAEIQLSLDREVRNITFSDIVDYCLGNFEANQP